MSILMSGCDRSCHPLGPPLTPCKRTTAATPALFWTSRLLRWQTWSQRFLLFHLATVSGTCCWETRRFRMMTGNVEKQILYSTAWDLLGGCFVFFLCMCASVCMHNMLMILDTWNSVVCCLHPFPSSFLMLFYFRYSSHIYQSLCLINPLENVARLIFICCVVAGFKSKFIMVIYSETNNGSELWRK